MTSGYNEIDTDTAFLAIERGKYGLSSRFRLWIHELP
jgi:hypothetical protein